MNDIGTVSAAVYYLQQYKNPLLGTLAGLAGAIAFAIKVPPHRWF